MSRNAESRFAVNPTRIDISRSTFDRSSSLKTSFNVGDIVPFYVDEVLPGDTFKIRTSKVIRLQTLLTPVMDNIYLDTYFFFVPNRLTWDHWKEFNGENTASAWVPSTEYNIPQITSPATTGWSVGTIADYFGIPTGVAGLSVSALPFRAYALIINEWFRDQNLQDPLVVPTDDSTVAGVNSATFVTDVAKGGKPYVASKYHDYFTSCLPAPQKGPDVTIPVLAGGQFPVISTTSEIDMSLNTSPLYLRSNASQVSESRVYSSPYVLQASSSASGGFNVAGTKQIGDSGWMDDDETRNLYAPANLWTSVGTNLATATINQLRLAFQIQKLYERDARGGTRYIEILKSHFGVTSPDARLQRPEYLGGNRLPITVNQVVQQSGTGSASETPQGTVVGQSLTTDSHHDFVKSFTEHGFVIGVMVARYPHTYQQGLERFWSRLDRFDYYWPVFANIGEQAVKNREIFAQGVSQDDEVFGYQEAWADYRYKPSRVTGEMRSSYAQSLDVWHLADDYSALPSLSASWIQEDKSNVDRVLAVTSQVSNQLFCDIFVQNKTTRPMPLYSVPGLIDHH
ncbi:major capsid protein [Tortoise microvirus 68]|nr:major capsid protein [Tortoise microvirus 68]